MKQKYDFLVVGSGLAGLSYALKVAKHGSVVVVSKSEISETNTKYAQGGIAAVIDRVDSYNKHVEDTLVAGDSLCNRHVVEQVVAEAPERIQELIDWGASFDKKPDGKFDLAREGGHSEHRILHHKDNTGAEIQRALVEQVHKHPNITVLEHFFAIDLITQHHLGVMVVRYQSDIECYGIYALDIKKQRVDTILAKTTFLATGGVGNIYETTTNPSIATGDGIAMVYRAKGTINNMEFIQFHPTALYNPKERPSFLISEAMRGFGAILRTRDGVAFMQKYDVRENLAPRDIVARAIDNEMKVRGDVFVHLDCTHLNQTELQVHFPNIHKKCLSLGIDLSKDCIPVVPAAHYACGGVQVDLDGRTMIANLYAAGETSSSGLHGANRLASNSLLESIFYAHRAATHAAQHQSTNKFNEKIPKWNDDGTSHTEEMVLITQEFKELQQIMSNYVGIVRSDLRLKRADDRLEILHRETEALFERSTVTQKLCELRNALNVARLIIKMAKRRKESRGLHYTIDYPKKNKLMNEK